MFNRIVDMPCMIYENFGIYCPGCGGRRAVKALFAGDVLSSIYYHPIVLYALAVIVFVIGSRIMAYISRGKIKTVRFKPIFLYIALIMIVLNCIVKNILKFVWGIEMI